jgi:hypothetical protein
MELMLKNSRDDAVKTAEQVSEYCRKKDKPDKWSLATEGEVSLLKGDFAIA